ncbi:MAG: hypothetical protein KA524_10590, partial [Nitrosomonas sp.]|nr:hypothetical protein [Nitrosomonas sp.]MBP6076779.1 hypothetical protein [Nitrosomonas sp.]
MNEIATFLVKSITTTIDVKRRGNLKETLNKSQKLVKYSVDLTTARKRIDETIRLVGSIIYQETK